MKVLIEIDDEVYKRTKEFVEKFDDNYAPRTPWNLIVNGTPLPKGHGRLIDADELKEDLEDCQYSKGFCAEHYIDYSIHMGIAKELIKDAPTIIEADKENKNESAD